MKKTKSEKVFDVINIFIMIFMVIICLYPFLYVVFASLSDSGKLMQHTGILLKPLGFSLGAYIEVIKNKMIAITYRNTLIYLVTGLAVSMTLTTMGAYVLSRKNVMIKSLLNVIVVITMFFSGGLIPFYLTIKQYGILNTIWCVILPGAVSTWNMIVMRTSFQAIPTSLEEAAAIDGASEWVILTRIILPVSKAIIAVMVLFYGVGIWNQWFYPSLFLRERLMYPLQVYLREVLINSNTDSMMLGNAGGENDRVAISETIKYSTIIVTTLPILCIYPFLQKYFVKGVMVGALKG